MMGRAPGAHARRREAGQGESRVEEKASASRAREIDEKDCRPGTSTVWCVYGTCIYVDELMVYNKSLVLKESEI